MSVATRIAYLALRQVPHPERPETYFEEVTVQFAPSVEREIVGQCWDDHTVAVFVGRMSGPKATPTLIAVWFSRQLRVGICADADGLGPKSPVLTMLKRMDATSPSHWGPWRNGAPNLNPSEGRTDV